MVVLIRALVSWIGLNVGVVALLLLRSRSAHRRQRNDQVRSAEGHWLPGRD